jgi:dipeptidyl aminopeptidase/acylaminoacyl peptidase
VNKAPLLFFLTAATILAGVRSAFPDDQTRQLVESLSKVSRCHKPTFSPDGRRIAMICDLTGTPQLWTVNARGGWASLVTNSSDAVTSAYWSPREDWIAFSRSPSGGLNEQIYIVRPDGSEFHQVTEGGTTENWLNGWSPNGKYLMIASNRRGGTGMDDYLVDPFRHEFMVGSVNETTGSYFDVSKDGRFALLERYHNRDDEDLYLVDLQNHKESLLTPHTGNAKFFGRLAPNARTVYLRSDIDRELSAFAEVPVSAEGKPGPIRVLANRNDGELQSAVPNRQGRNLALFWNVAGAIQLTFYSPQDRRMSAAPILPTEIADADEMDFSPDERYLALTLYGSVSAPNVWILDLQTRRYRQLTFSNHPGVRLDSLVRPKLLHYRAVDGLPLSGWLYLPHDATGSRPLVLSIHGGPETQEVPTFHSDYQALLANGIGVFAPNIRGSAGFGKTFVNLDNGPLRVNAIRDVKDTVDYLVATGIADPKRIGIMGGSYGGYVVMESLADYPQLFAAGADLFGVVNFETFFQHTESWMAAGSKAEYGDPETQLDLLRQLSPIHKIDRVKAPVLVMHGDHDTNVPLEEAEQVVAALKARRIPVSFIIFPGEGHGWQKISTRVDSNVAVTEWFRKYLQVPSEVAPTRP